MTREKMIEILETKKKFQQGLDSFLSAYMSGEEMKELHALIADFYAKKANSAINALATERGWTQETYDGWLNEHNRTAYK